MSYMEPSKIDSEMEEGEIVDDLSDISSEEEYVLLRKRLHVLEKYNTVLERTKAKRSSIVPGANTNKQNHLSEIPAAELEETCVTFKNDKYAKTRKSKKRKDPEPNNNIGKFKDKRKIYKNKRKSEVVNESSEESEDEYKNKRWKLANAVNISKQNTDKSSLSARLKTMLNRADEQDLTKSTSDNKLIDNRIKEHLPLPGSVKDKDNMEPINSDPRPCELIDIVSDEDIVIIESKIGKDNVNLLPVTNDVIVSKEKADKDSDEDLELLRKHALETKTAKQKEESKIKNVNDIKMLSEDEDSDTSELRLICLKSAMLKKAIEKKQKEKLKKRLSQSSNLPDDILNGHNILLVDSDNNTDVESIDMDIGSDGDDRCKITQSNENECKDSDKNKERDQFAIKIHKEDELDEDEDLLRAKLLTSLTKNLPNLLTQVDEEPIEKDGEQNTANPAETVKASEVPLKRFIINVGESDSEGEHEATKNLTKMHLKLSSEQNDFQERLDMFLKSTRMEVEKTKLPDVVQEPAPRKFVAKAVSNLPKSEQMEYKNLVKRMAELEKIKQVRQSYINNSNKSVAAKDTLKPRNIAMEVNPSSINNLENQIALSRKKIAEESAKILKLKEQGTKLSQKYKIVTTELFNITTAINYNKKQQRLLQMNLAKIRSQHQLLLKSSNNTIHSMRNSNITLLNQINKSTNRLQKENNPTREDQKNLILKNNKVLDLKNEAAIVNKLPADVNISKDKTPKSSTPEKKTIEIAIQVDVSEISEGNNVNVAEIDTDSYPTAENEENIALVNDYRSPLEALGHVKWEADPNAILCPFEVGGVCKDPRCIYLHTKPVQP